MNPQRRINMLGGATPRHPTRSSTPASLFRVEANHRIANNLAVISGLVQLQALQVSKRGRDMPSSEVHALLENIAAQITTVGVLHRLLSQHPSDTVELGAYFGDICAALTKAFDGRVELIDVTEGGCVVASQQALPLGVIISELVTNAIKYAHPTGIAGSIRIECDQRGDGAIRIEIADDGVGLPEGFDPTTDGGLGLRVVRLLSEQLGGSATFRTDGLGLTVELLVPAGT